MGHRKSRKSCKVESENNPETGREQGYYGSGGSYGYGGGFEYPNEPDQENDSTADRGWFHGIGPMEPFDAYGSFGSTLGDHEQPPQHVSERALGRASDEKKKRKQAR